MFLKNCRHSVWKPQSTSWSDSFHNEYNAPSNGPMHFFIFLGLYYGPQGFCSSSLLLFFLIAIMSSFDVGLPSIGSMQLFHLLEFVLWPFSSSFPVLSSFSDWSFIVICFSTLFSSSLDSVLSSLYSLDFSFSSLSLTLSPLGFCLSWLSFLSSSLLYLLNPSSFF